MRPDHLRLPGPSASWVDEDDGPDIHGQVRSDVVMTLTQVLTQRIQRLEAGQIDDVITEIRLQMMECAASGNLGRASDLADLAVSFVTTMEYKPAPPAAAVVATDDESEGL